MQKKLVEQLLDTHTLKEAREVETQSHQTPPWV